MPKEYQNHLANLLHRRLNNLEIFQEWNAFAGDGFHFQYSPRVDIAFGPLSTVRGGNQIENYNLLIEREPVNGFLRQIYNFHCQNMDVVHYDEIVITPYDQIIRKNLNARCFLAVEIENNNSRKHTLGSIVNASSLGRIGIGVAYSNGAFKMFRRIINYLAFLRRVEKNTYDTTNFFVITREQLDGILEE